jgi:two-component system, NtrC family, nitrogen regulation response regulator GlnG
MLRMMMSKAPTNIWVIDDDRSVRIVLTQALRDAGYGVQHFDRADVALSAMQTETLPACVITDVRMPGMDGIAFLAKIKSISDQIPVIVMSAFTDVASTGSAFRGGAHEFLSKPFDLDEAVALVTRVLPATNPASESEGLFAAKASPVELLGNTPAMRELFRAIGRLAQAPLSVLIMGETGTGKELVARALHRESPRTHKPFIAINTAAIPAELLESELFGYEAGAFTGALKKQMGRFEQANGGTLFLDEIGDMPAALQTRLLRVLAEGEFYRVGGRELMRVDVRVIAATHQNLDALVQQQKFRADLLHRLDVVRLHMPPLRERKHDIPLLAQRFIVQASLQLNAPAKQFKTDAMAKMQQHPWPGNVRELENLCWRLAALAPGETIGLKELQACLREPNNNNAADAKHSSWLKALAIQTHSALQNGDTHIHAHLREQFDQVLLETAIAFTDGHRQQAAEKLGLGRNTLTRKLGNSRKTRIAREK